MSDTDRDELPVVIFDGDDTLWRTEHLYDDARSAAARVVATTGVDPRKWERLQRAIDVINVQTMGLSRERFPLSCAQAYVICTESAGIPYVDRVAQRVAETARAVFAAPALNYPESAAVLETLWTTWRLALLTQGDAEVQRCRVEESGLREWFDVIEIVELKDQTVLAAVLERLGAAASNCWMVGNSLRSDIKPAVACGMRAIWIDAHVWEHERDEAFGGHELVVVARNLAEVPALILAAGGGQSAIPTSG